MNQPGAQLPRGPQQDESPEHVGAHEVLRAEDRAVDVSLRREIDDRIDVPDLIDVLADRDVAAVARYVGGQIGLVPGIGELVEDDDVLPGGQHPLDEVRPDEAGAACD